MMGDSLTTISELKWRMQKFSRERNWEHNPKDLAITIATEAAEVLELYRFRREAQNPEDVGDELADVLFGVCLLADALGIDLSYAVESKHNKSAVKYPAAEAPY